MLHTFGLQVGKNYAELQSNAVSSCMSVPAISATIVFFDAKHPARAWLLDLYTLPFKGT